MELVKSLKQSRLIKYIFFALIGSIVLAISSKIKIPFYPVPMTMQTLVVLMIGIAFGWKIGLATVSLYLFEAQEMCDRIAIIDKGNLVALDTTKKLLERIQAKKINFKVESVDINMSLVMEGIQFKIISKNLITASYEKSSLNFGEIVNYFNKNNIKIVDISTDDGDLEDVFVQLTKH